MIPASPIISRTPPTSVATTGFSIAIASPTTNGIPSRRRTQHKRVSAIEYGRHVVAQT